MSGRIIKGVTHFVYILEIEEFNQRVCEKENNFLDKFSSDSSIQLATYAMAIARHPTSDIELSHCSEITEFYGSDTQGHHSGK